MGYLIWALIKYFFVCFLYGLFKNYYYVLLLWALIKNYYYGVTSLYNLSILNNILHLNII